MHRKFPDCCLCCCFGLLNIEQICNSQIENLMFQIVLHTNSIVLWSFDHDAAISYRLFRLNKINKLKNLLLHWKYWKCQTFQLTGYNARIPAAIVFILIWTFSGMTRKWKIVLETKRKPLISLYFFFRSWNSYVIIIILKYVFDVHLCVCLSCGCPIDNNLYWHFSFPCHSISMPKSL